MGRLASQTAAHKLGQILGLLVIPILVLWFIYFIKAKTEIDGLTRELSGVELVQLMTASAEPTDRQRQLEETLALKPVAQAVGAPLAAAHLAKVSRASGLSVDAELQSNALAELALLNVPALEKLVANALPAPKSGAMPKVPDIAMMAQTTGEVNAVLRQMRENLALTSMHDDPLAVKAMERYGALASTLEKTVSGLNVAFATQVDQAELLGALGQQQLQMKAEVHAPLQAKVLDKLQQRLSLRRAAMWRNLLLLTVAGLASALAGVGLAVLMMRSTLIQLDEVELSRSDAHAAKREAEQLNAQFSTINSDISKLNTDLAHKMQELKLAQDELVKKGRMEQLGQLTATIAHEIRNPLGAIRTSAFLLQRKTAALGTDVSGHLQRINNGVNRCDDIISQLLDFSRTKGINSNLSLLDDWLVQILREEAKRLPENVSIECALGLGDQQVPFDGARLQRAVINLLSNASEALASGPDQAGRSQRAQIVITTLRQGDFACIRVADNGPGIPADILGRIREPLFTTKSFGTGLGIPAVEQIVTQHGGHLDISSVSGQGAAFTIHLPLTRAVGVDDAA